jgi:hopene-associated glycosyltransferase HpnB
MWGLAIGWLSWVIWVYLLTLRGQFWRTDQQLDTQPELSAWPQVAVVIPARNEAESIETVLTSLFEQDYPIVFPIYLVDDQSTDDTVALAKSTAAKFEQPERLKIITAKPLPTGWTGKLWALEQGIAVATAEHAPDYLLLTDADIRHDRSNLKNLVAKAVIEQRDLVSLMVRLRCESFWEKLLIPAFVFFFAKLYPFRQVNDPNSAIAAAAGGCSLIQRQALMEIGGIGILRDALIDDCTLAAKVKHRSPSAEKTKYHSIWLGLTTTTDSIRPYETLESIWNMVARTAYTQLNYSPLLLLGTLFGMYLVYLAAPIGIITAVFTHQIALLILSLITYGLMTISYTPINRFYGVSLIYAFCLPAIGLLYTLMTIDSARRHWQGKGGQWKGRSY